WRGVVLTSIAAGAAVAIGYGFRSDVVIAIPAFVLTALLFLDTGWRERLRYGVVGCVAFFAPFFIVGWPVISGGQRAWSCQWHTGIIGLGHTLTRALQLQPPPYDWMAGETDEFVAVETTSYAARVQPGVKPIGFCSPEYGD